MFEFLAPKFKLNVKYLALSIRNALENFKDFFLARNPNFSGHF